MQKLKAVLVLLFTLSITGCAKTPEPVVKYEYIEVQKPVYHPARPAAVHSYVPNWTVKDGSVQMTYNESVRYRIWLEQVLGYIKSQNLIICSYRKDLNEPECTK